MKRSKMPTITREMRSSVSFFPSHQKPSIKPMSSLLQIANGSSAQMKPAAKQYRFAN
jgi:hypothetical protein